MVSSFIVSQPVYSTRHASSSNRRRAPLCLTDPSKPAEPSRDLSQTDRQYRAKIKARFMNSRHAAAAARANSADPTAWTHDTSDDEMTAALPDDLDAMEDVLFDRAPNNIGQVKMFGAWLDEAVAGRKANDKSVTPDDVKDDRSDISVEANRPPQILKHIAIERADLAFSRAMQLFNKGMYNDATFLYAEAVSLVGPESRLGGQYQLWQGQSLDAEGKKPDAVVLLKKLDDHRDSEIRKVARELLFIMMAPSPKLDPESYLDIPHIDETKSNVSKGLLLSNYGPLRTALVEKAPEPYSLQWYLEKKRAPKVADHSRMHAIVLSVAIFGTLAFMAASPR